MIGWAPAQRNDNVTGLIECFKGMLRPMFIKGLKCSYEINNDDVPGFSRPAKRAQKDAAGIGKFFLQRGPTADAEVQAR